MAAPVATNALSLEAQVLETFKALADAEAVNDPVENRASINMNENNGSVTLQVTLPATFTTDGNGDLLVAVTPYLGVVV